MTHSSFAATRPSAWLFSSVLCVALGGCDMVEGLLGGGADEACAQAEGMLASGDLPGAADAWAAAAADDPTAVCAATGHAFGLLLQGDTAGAEAALAAAQDGAGDAGPMIHLRRALVALEAGNLDAVRQHGEASGLPQGQLLAAEVALADGEREEALSLLTGAQGGGGDVAATAKAYTALINDADPLVAGLSEAQALWALGERVVAVQSVEALVKNLSDDRGDREQQLLVWAGRAASVGETDVASSLLDAIIFAPEGQQWRRIATRAIIACADGRGETCLTQFQALEGNAPSDGLADARATAAVLIAGTDDAVARQLASPYISNAAARALVETGDLDAARESAPGGVLSDYLKAGG